jgi:hypothetical protein
MSTLDPTSHFEGCRALLEKALSRDADIGDVEQAIDCFALDGEEKAALWLWATAQRNGAGAWVPGRSIIGRQAQPGIARTRNPAHEGETDGQFD